jgi:hypothetical protein
VGRWTISTKNKKARSERKSEQEEDKGEIGERGRRATLTGVFRPNHEVLLAKLSYSSPALRLLCRLGKRRRKNRSSLPSK